MLLFSGKVSTAMSKVKTCGIVDQSTDSIKINNVQIYKEVDLSKIGVGAAKIFLRIISEFTAHNTQNQDREKLNLTVHISFNEYAQDNGVDTTSDSAVKKFRFVLHKYLGTLQTILVKWREKVKGKPMSYGAVNLFSYHEIKNNAISVKLTQEFAESLVQLPIIPVSQSLFAVDNRNANAFAIGYEMLLHYGINNNVMKGTEDKLRVETLLKCTSFETPEDLSKSRHGWWKQVKDRFEQALDELTRCGLLKDYCYCHAGGVELSDDEAMNINSYEQWSQLIVKYELNDPNNPTHWGRYVRLNVKVGKNVFSILTAHMNKIDEGILNGTVTTISPGMVIGLSGNTGRTTNKSQKGKPTDWYEGKSSGYHTHLETWIDGRRFDPQTFFNRYDQVSSGVRQTPQNPPTPAPRRTQQPATQPSQTQTGGATLTPVTPPIQSQDQTPQPTQQQTQNNPPEEQQQPVQPQQSVTPTSNSRVLFRHPKTGNVITEDDYKKLLLEADPRGDGDPQAIQKVDDLIRSKGYIRADETPSQTQTGGTSSEQSGLAQINFLNGYGSITGGRIA